MIVLIDLEKAFDKIHLFVNFLKCQLNGYTGNIPQHNNSHMWQTHS